MDNPQAFPHGDPTNGGDIGMTLRDYFAGQALMGAISASSGTGPDHIKIFAEVAYILADAMLAERSKK